ncbi:hypothetical protein METBISCDRAFT_24248 [Metschnikowia bicuspidata]|uniref:FCH-domain-containing protein n=1 Tax=Metschnikowia bicuspidata TaxID=27322 RepID=A0A4P9ZA19_9ASCO|nr:hypothetical protein METBISCDRAFT_24248 [Metschnikowia bicuspidata]
MSSSDQAFVNSFWGLHDAGFAAVQLRIRTSQATLNKLLSFYKKRVTIEKVYYNLLERLAASSKYYGETGSLKIALDKLQIELEKMVQQHNKYVRSVSHHNYEKLRNFSQIYQKNIVKIENHMQKVLARKRHLWHVVTSTKEKYRSACAQEKTLTLQCQTTWGKELDAKQANLQKIRTSLPILAHDYDSAIARYKEIHAIWVRDWSIALLNVYLLEVERIQVCKLNCFSFCNHLASLCVDWDQSVDATRTAFANVAAPKDVADSVVFYGTGCQIPSPPEFVDFSRGCDDPQGPQYTTANFKDPDYTQILSRTFSSHSAAAMVPAAAYSRSSPQKDPSGGENHPARTPSPQKLLPPIKKPLQMLLPHSNGPGTSPETHTMYSKQPSQYSNATTDSNDIFDGEPRGASTHLSVYLRPSSYFNERSWASPRRKLRQALQQEINRRLQDMSYMLAKTLEKPADGSNLQRSKMVPITKDFSIDFIAKALDDLNAGGNGDVNKFRRSVRQEMQAASAVRPLLDSVDDWNELATRKDTIVFRTPDTNVRKLYAGLGNGTELKQPNMPDLLPLVRKKPDLTQQLPLKGARHMLLQSPTKSFKNLNAFVEGITPVTRAKCVTKAVAKYSYKAREAGELSFSKGWRMYIIHKQEDNWYACELGENCGSERGTVGLVPYNYVVEGEDVF